MKLYLTCLILLLVMIVGCTLGVRFVCNLVEETRSAVTAATDLYRTGNTSEAASTLRRSEAVWRRQETLLGALLSHEDLDAVMTGFATLQAHAINGDPDDYYGLAASFLVQLEHIAETEQPSIKNIF